MTFIDQKKTVVQRLRCLWLIGVFYLSLSGVVPTQAQSVYVPLNHWMYEFIQRLETKQVIGNVLSETKPLTRMEIARYLYRLFENEAALTKVEQEQFDFLKLEFKEEFAELIDTLMVPETRLTKLRRNRFVKKVLPDIIYRNDRNFLSWHQRQEFRLFIDPILSYQCSFVDADTSPHSEKNYHFTNGARAYGQIGEHLGFFIDARDNKEWGTNAYAIGNYTLPGLGFVRATSPDFIYHDETEAYVKLGFKYVELTYGKFQNYWGPGATGSLILSNNATSYDQLKCEIRYKQFKFTSIYAFLIDYQEYESDSLQQRKYFAGHRLEFAPWRWLTLGLSEIVVFNGRSFEPSYLNPVMFYRSAEHYLGSPDNMLLGLDVKFLAIKNLKIYGELLIDDITTSKLGSDWYGNKLGYLIGAFWIDPFKMKNSAVRLEYARIRPYVYSHENALSYKHYDSLLGHPIGPNADELYLDVSHQLSKWTTMRLFSKFSRHGENFADRNVGGDVNLPHRFGDDLSARFLGGNLEKRNIIGVKFSYEVFRDFFLRMEYGWMDYSNVVIKNDVRGKSQTSLFAFSIGLNY